jgi:single-stranded-DNA-specific exonuclease
MPLAEALKGARQRPTAFLAGLEPETRISAFCHCDADGLAAGAVFGRALHRLGFNRVEVVASLEEGPELKSDRVHERRCVERVVGR